MNAEALIGTVLGTCTLQELIGQGGMGAVFLAQQSRPRRQVAIKVLLPMVQLKPEQHASFLERFRRETDAAASLDHPNILPVHEYGERDGLAYLVMPYISGGTLRDELEREKRLPWTSIVSYLDQMAAALDAAHARGVIHRDIKPANILITPEKRLLLSDFGLVKLMSEEQNAPLTKVGMPMGTPDYMAPEQVIGRDVDAHADLYSLGVILYQMVTGEVPFKGDLPMQVAMQHLHMRPSSPRQLRPDLPPVAEHVILRALAKRPDDRYPSAQEMATAFRLALLSTGIVLGDELVRGFTANMPIASVSSQFMKSRGLFDPAWQNSAAPTTSAKAATSMEEDEQTTPRMSAVRSRARRPVSPALVESGMISGISLTEDGQQRNDIVAQTKMTLPSFTDLLTPEPPKTVVPSPATEANGIQPPQFSFSPANPPTTPGVSHSRGNTPLPQTRGLLGRRTSQLRPMSLEEPQNAVPMQESASSANGDAVPLMPPTPPQMPFPTQGSMENGTPFAGSEQKTAASSSPNNANNTSALTMPGGYADQGMTTTLRLTQSMKIVKMPVAGQPGRYVTGLLRMPSSSLTPPPVESAVPAFVQRSKDYIEYLKNNLKQVAVVGVVLLLVITSSLFWLAHSHTTTTAHLGTRPTPNLAATAALQATATADANIILTDPLSQNIHDWPISTNAKGPQTYAFKGGAYHVTDTNAQSSALALLPPEEQLPTSFVYTLTMEEVKGDDTTINNQFGMVFRLATHQHNGASSTTFYAFDVANTPGGEYQFWKYDDSYGSSVNPWTKLWSTPFGKEYHYGHGAAGRNTFSVLIQGTKYTFVVNGKKVGTAQDVSYKSGQIGMLVNWDGTEVAFSNLILTYH